MSSSCERLEMLLRICQCQFDQSAMVASGKWLFRKRRDRWLTGREDRDANGEGSWSGEGGSPSGQLAMGGGSSTTPEISGVPWEGTTRELSLNMGFVPPVLGIDCR